MMRFKQYTCARCQEEVAPGAVWCPHCGFDMSSDGSLERRRRLRGGWTSAFDHAARKLAWGVGGAALVFLSYLLISTQSGSKGLAFGGFCFVIAIWIFAADLSVRALLYTTPTMAATLAFLSIK